MLVLALLGFFQTNALASTKGFEATFTDIEVVIDGHGQEAVWQQANWYPLDQLILGQPVSNDDFTGRFQLAWDNNYLYLRAEISDDILIDRYADPLLRYWDDDCLEIFIDEDGSGGEHQNNFNAFAYHVALDNQVADIGPLKINKQTNEQETNFILLNDHVSSVWQRSTTAPHLITWELAIKIYSDKFKIGENKDASRVSLKEHKKLGFMLAYCDNDGSEERESFIGSTFIKGINGDKNLGYKTADVFESLILKAK